MKKYILTVIMLATLLLATPTFASTFSDIEKESELDVAIKELRAKEVISGYPDATFKPNNAVTRGQLAKMIAVSLKLQAPAAVVTFTDVPNKHPNYAYIQALVAHKIVNGYPDGTFKPNAVVTRSQAAKMIATAYNVPRYEAALPFTDIKKTSERYQDIQALYFNGIAAGTSATTFSPTNKVTRGQAALFIYRAWQLQKGAIVKEMTLNGHNSIEIIAQDGNFFKTIITDNKLRVLPLHNGSGTLFVKGDDDQYFLYEVNVANKKASLKEVDWHNYVELQLNYYTFSSLQIPFPMQSFAIRNSDGELVSSDHYFVDYNDAGIELALFMPGQFILTFKGESGESKSVKLVSKFSKMTLETLVFL